MGGEIEVFDCTAEEDHGAEQAVRVFVAISDGVLYQTLKVCIGWEDVVEAGPGRSQGVAAAEGGIEEIARPDAVFVSFPEGIAAICLEPFDAGLASFAAFDHALDGFEAVEV